MPRYKARVRVTEWYEFEFEAEDMDHAADEALDRLDRAQSCASFAHSEEDIEMLELVKED